MRRDVAADFSWQRRLLPEVKAILGQYLIGEAPFEEDAQRNTDLIVLKLDAVRIGCRLRRYEYLAKWPDEFTIRTTRPSGADTELSKLISGWGDYFFYGFANQSGTNLASWMLGSLHVFRLWHSRQLVELGGKVPGKHQDNDDGSSTFRAFRIDALPPEFIVARHIVAVPARDIDADLSLLVF